MSLRQQVSCWILLVIWGAMPLTGFAVGGIGIGPEPSLVGVRTAGVRAQPFGPRTDVTYVDLSLGVGETDNVLLTATDKISQTLALAGLDFEVRRHGTRLNADLKGDFAYLDYLQGAYGKQLLGRFDGELTFALIPDALVWVVTDNFGESALNPYVSATTPTNLERTNVVTTGPDIVLRPEEAIFLGLSARYSYSSYQTSRFDSKRRLGIVTIGRDLSPASSVSLNASAEALRYPNTVTNTNYNHRKYYIRYDLRGARTQISANVGADQANDRGHWVTTPLVQLDSSRTISRYSKLTFVAARQFVDIADSFRTLQSGATGGIVVAPVVGTTAAYLSEYASAGWEFERYRTSLGISGKWERSKYDSQYRAFDVNRRGIEVRFGRRMSSMIRAEAFGWLYREDYAGRGFSDTYSVLGANMILRPGKRTGFRIHYEHNHSTSSGARGLAYTENRVFLVAEYQLLP